MFDIDYLSQLTPKELDWLNKFVKEYYHANVKRNSSSALHRKKRLRQDCYTRKNAQNRDLMSIFDCRGKMDRITHEERSNLVSTIQRNIRLATLESDKD